MNTIKVLDQRNVLEPLWAISGIGSISTISMSKIRKIIVILKNRNLKGLRVIICGSNPHSKGDDFSLSLRVFFLKIKQMAIRAMTIVVFISSIKIFLSFKDFLSGN
jgi:hypothetical protein